MPLTCRGISLRYKNINGGVYWIGNGVWVVPVIEYYFEGLSGEEQKNEGRNMRISWYWILCKAVPGGGPKRSCNVIWDKNRVCRFDCRKKGRAFHLSGDIRMCFSHKRSTTIVRSWCDWDYLSDKMRGGVVTWDLKLRIEQFRKCEIGKESLVGSWMM